MPEPREIMQLIERVHRIANEEERQALPARLAAVDRPFILSFVNAHAVTMAARNAQTLEAFLASDMILRDGVALQLGLPKLGIDPGVNMNGTDFIPLALRQMPSRRLGIFGTASPWLERGRDRLAAVTTHDIVACEHGFHPTGHYVEVALRTQPDVILLAMGMPRQEQVAVALRAAFDHPVLIINGGAIIDFLADRVRRAPVAMQRAGLEWVFRLAQEPRRLIGRYGLGSFRFAHTLLSLRRVAGNRPPGTTAPTH